MANMIIKGESYSGFLGNLDTGNSVNLSHIAEITVDPVYQSGRPGSNSFSSTPTAYKITFHKNDVANSVTPQVWKFDTEENAIAAYRSLYNRELADEDQNISAPTPTT